MIIYTLNDAIIHLTIDFILSRVSEEDIFSKYCSNFKELGKPFCSELRKDLNPSCVIYQTKAGRLMYKDYGNTDISQENGKMVYQFLTNTDGVRIAKSPEGCLERYEPNDCRLIIDKIEAYQNAAVKEVKAVNKL